MVRLTFTVLGSMATSLSGSYDGLGLQRKTPRLIGRGRGVGGLNAHNKAKGVI